MPVPINATVRPLSSSAVWWAKVSMPLARPAMTVSPRSTSMWAQFTAKCAPSGVQWRDPTTLTPGSSAFKSPLANKNGGTSMVARKRSGNLGSNTEAKSKPWSCQVSKSRTAAARASLIRSTCSGLGPMSSSNVPCILSPSVSSRSSGCDAGSILCRSKRSALPSSTQSLAMEVQVSGFSQVLSKAISAEFSRMSSA